VHGESTVCTTVEIQQGPRVRHIVIDDLIAASGKAEGLQGIKLLICLIMHLFL